MSKGRCDSFVIGKRQVKNNIAKFEGDDFMFELDDEEVENLSRCKNFTLNKGRGSNIKYKQNLQ